MLIVNENARRASSIHTLSLLALDHLIWWIADMWKLFIKPGCVLSLFAKQYGVFGDQVCSICMLGICNFGHFMNANSG